MSELAQRLQGSGNDPSAEQLLVDAQKIRSSEQIQACLQLQQTLDQYSSDQLPTEIDDPGIFAVSNEDTVQKLDTRILSWLQQSANFLACLRYIPARNGLNIIRLNVELESGDFEAAKAILDQYQGNESEIVNQSSFFSYCWAIDGIDSKDDQLCQSQQQIAVDIIKVSSRSFLVMV